MNNILDFEAFKKKIEEESKKVVVTHMDEFAFLEHILDMWSENGETEMLEEYDVVFVPLNDEDDKEDK